MPTHKSEDYKLSAVEYYLTEDKTFAPLFPKVDFTKSGKTI